MRISSLFTALAVLLGAGAASAEDAPPPPGAPATSEAAPEPTAPAPAPAPVEPMTASSSPPEADAPSESADEREERPLRRGYVSFSPIHLVLPVLEVTAEVRVHPQIGVAAIGGFGKVNASSSLIGGPDVSVTVWEAGGQLVGYPIGTFDHGMQVGAEVLYAGASMDGSADVKLVATSTGLSTGGFVGYKLATAVGFTFNVQAGVAYMAVRAEAKDSPSAAQERALIYPLANINVGWSF